MYVIIEKPPKNIVKEKGLTGYRSFRNIKQSDFLASSPLLRQFAVTRAMLFG